MLKRLALCLSLSVFTCPLFAGIVVLSPSAGDVQSPFKVDATAYRCSSRDVVSMGYSLDSSPDALTRDGQSLSVSVAAPTGAHVLHIKAWAKERVCVTDVDITVQKPAVGPTIPVGATAVSDIQVLDKWHWNHDKGTPGTAEGSSQLVNSPSLSGTAREFASSYTDAGGEIYSVSYADDPNATHFVYDGYVYITAGSDIKNLELDSNQVIANGNTVIYAFQCNGYASVWDYSGAGAHWVHSKQPCNVANWTKNAWHHVQIAYHRDAAGENVTYEAVWLDGVEQDINATVPSSFPLGWGQVVQTQFQVDGPGASGTSLLYLDKLTITRW